MGEAPTKDAEDEEDKVENAVHTYGSKSLKMPNTSDAPIKEVWDEKDAKAVNPKKEIEEISETWVKKLNKRSSFKG